MDQVNINSGPPIRQPPPRSPAKWPIYVFIVALIIVGAVLFAVKHSTSSSTATATATPGSGAAATSTAAPGTAPDTATPSTGADTATPAVATDTPAPQAPTNPTALHVTSGSCGVHQISWTWSRATGATSYEIVLYDPRTGATIKDTTVSGTSYTLSAGAGARVALKVRSHNAAGAARDYYTPGSVGHVPPDTTNPTAMTSSTANHTITWSWTGAQHATAYDFVLYHYDGGVAKNDVAGRTDQGHWSTKVTPGVAYYLKVRSAGACAPSTYYTPSTSTMAGATPTTTG